MSHAAMVLQMQLKIWMMRCMMQQLFRAAERIVKESCGEKWLLQPFIPDMERNEYRCQTATLIA